MLCKISLHIDSNKKYSSAILTYHVLPETNKILTGRDVTEMVKEHHYRAKQLSDRIERLNKTRDAKGPKGEMGLPGDKGVKGQKGEIGMPGVKGMFMNIVETEVFEI